MIQLLGRDTKTGVLRSVVGDWRAMHNAIMGLRLGPGVEVGVFLNDDGVDCLCEPDYTDAELRLLALGAK